MDLRHLRYFQAVAEELSFSKASRRLRIAQPALSRAVQELEQDLGMRLNERNRRTMALTPAGAVLLAEGRGRPRSALFRCPLVSRGGWNYGREKSGCVWLCCGRTISGMTLGCRK